MKLVFHNPLTEADWFTFLLSDVVDEVVYDTTYAGTHGRAIHVVSGNVVPLRGRSAYFEKCRAESDDLTLLRERRVVRRRLHECRHFDRVIRNHRTWLMRAPGIFSIPVGYPCGLAGPDRLTPADQRSASGHSKARSRRLASRWSKR